MSMESSNYFVCTLGQASALTTKAIRHGTISEFLAHQSRHCGSNPAIGFLLPRHEDAWDHKLLTFSEVYAGTQVFAERLSRFIEQACNGPQTVALMAHSSPEFLFTWLGLMHLGHSVLLLAPQCQPAAVVHLCKACNVSLIFYDAAHAQRAKEAETLQLQHHEGRFSTQQLPLGKDENIFAVHGSQDAVVSPATNVHETAVAYLHHTSGTSSGLPKPIPQSHRAAIGVLPHMPGAVTKATFTTTPLYHGGIADTFRSWTSDSPIWLFPSQDLPITARNICKCLDVAKSCSTHEQTPEVKYFSSVPYVLQMMEADDSGVGMLKSMDIVGVGGAALPIEVGDRLVNHGVNLISRFGSAECGFLLSSFRDFPKDKDWQYLRNHNPEELLMFEDREDDLAELVVRPGWPHMAKKNRDDGSFATADLFQRHSSINNAWFYHSRADSQLTLMTGKKFDPAPLEAAIATAEILDDVLIFGNQQPYPGALLLRSRESSSISDAEVIDLIWPHVDKLNRESQDHARIARHMLIPIDHQNEPLEKSSKGTVIRKAAEARFASYIDTAYDADEKQELEHIEDEDLPRYLTTLVQSMLQSPDPPAEDTDLFSYGVDSIACMRLRRQLQQLIPNYNTELPLSIVENCGTIHNMSKYIIAKRYGGADTSPDENQLMLDLAQEFSNFHGLEPDTQNEIDTNGTTGKVVVLTGATGALGAHILDLLRKSSSVSAIYCLVRGADPAAAHERVSKALSQRGLMPLPLEHSSSIDSKIKVIQSKLSDPNLGLSPTLYSHLAAHASLILHIAWTVNFRLRLPSFAADNIPSVRHLLSLALAANRPNNPPRFAYCSSTAAIIGGTLDAKGTLPERIASDPTAASPLGYSRSKWVAEHICLAAHERTRLRDRIAVVRVGQLAGDSGTGTWNTKEAWPMMLSTARLVGCLPDLRNEPLDWLPVDVAARAFLQAAQCSLGDDGGAVEAGTGDMPVFHVLNPHAEPTWTDMLGWLRKKEDFEVVAPTEWVRRLEQCEAEGHSAMKLLGLWKEAYCPLESDGEGKSDEKANQKRPIFSVEQTQKRVPAMRDVRPVNEEYMGKIWKWVLENVH